MPESTRLVALTHSISLGQSLLASLSGEKIRLDTLPDDLHLADHLQHHRIDAVLLDAQDGVDGGVEHAIESLARIRRTHEPAALPVIVLLETSNCNGLVRLLQAGASDFIIRPVSAEVLIDRLDAIRETRDEVGQLIEAERQTVMSETLVRTSAIAAQAIGKIVDRLEHLMHAAPFDTGSESTVSADIVPAETVVAGGVSGHAVAGHSDITSQTTADEPSLYGLLEHTERAVEVIDRLQQIALMDGVPYAARKHLLDTFNSLK